MADAAGSMVVAEMKGIALPIFIFTLVVVTGVLLWGLRILQGVLLRTDPDNPKLRFIDKALSEKRLVRAVDPPPQPNPAPNPAPSPPAGQKSDEVPSTSRLGAAVGTLVLAVMALGVGYYMALVVIHPTKRRSLQYRHLLPLRLGAVRALRLQPAVLHLQGR